MTFEKLEEFKNKSGLYLITFTRSNQSQKGNRIYIGSTVNFKKRYKEHCNDLIANRHDSKYMQRVYNMFGVSNFKFEVICTIEDEFLMTKKEGLLIRLFNAEFNTCKYPEFSGKPNLGKKFPKLWCINMHKNKTYKHLGNIKTKITENNKIGATKWKVVEKSTNIEIIFNSKLELNKFFGTKLSTTRLLSPNCRLKKLYNIDLLTTQTKKVQLVLPNRVVHKFNSASDCDKFLNLWRGATSNAILNNNGKLQISYYVKYI